uniref:Uncharacterized protein n=1 Tax=Sphaerodactylus townsendi TaxID=933632 RepID=A0ACB8FXD7_9SAUR
MWLAKRRKAKLTNPWMIQQQEPEDQEALKDFQNNIEKELFDQLLDFDPQKEFGSSPVENFNMHLKIQQQELEDQEAPKDFQNNTEEELVDRLLDFDPQKEFGSSPVENLNMHLKVLIQQQQQEPEEQLIDFDSAEFGSSPMPSIIPPKILLQQLEEELEDQEAPRVCQNDIEEEPVDQLLDFDPEKKFGSSTKEYSKAHIKVLVRALL